MPRKPDIGADIVAAARRKRDQIARTCDVPRAADMSISVFDALAKHQDATGADGMFALAMAAAAVAATVPPNDRAPLAAAIGLLILDFLPLAADRLATPQVLH